LAALTYASLHGQFWNEVNNREKWVAQNQVEKQKQLLIRQHLGVSRLLARLCDCVVELGPDLQILEPCAQLAALLLVTGGVRKLEQRSFSDYMASDEEWHRFSTALRDRSKDSSSAETLDVGMVLVHLKDAQGKEFAVHAHHTCFQDLDNTPRYLVGIVEREERSLPLAPLCAGSGALLDEARTWHSQQLPSVQESMSSSSSAAMVPFEDFSAPVEEVSAWIDLGRKGLPVLKFTPGFTLLMGPSRVGVKMLDLCIQPKKFIKWLQDEMRPIMDDEVGYESSEANTGSTFTGGLLYPGTVDSRIVIQVQCQVDLEKSACPDEEVAVDERAIPVLVRFVNIAQHATRKHKSREHIKRDQDLCDASNGVVPCFASHLTIPL